MKKVFTTAILMLATLFFVGCEAPKAEISVSEDTIYVGESISFDGSSSSSVNGDITTYVWTDTEGKVLSHKSTFTKTFEASGEYIITLTVTDTANQSSETAVTVTVNEVVPVTCPKATLEVDESSLHSGAAPYVVTLSEVPDTDVFITFSSDYYEDIWTQGWIKFEPTDPEELNIVIPKGSIEMNGSLHFTVPEGDPVDEKGYILRIENTSCGSEKVIFDPNVDPVTVGNWYKPDANTSWQWQLQGAINESYNVDIYDIDLFDSDPSLIQSLQASGKKVICYFSAGSYENWRDDKNDFPDSILGNTLDGWEGERWLDISNEEVAPIMIKRLELAVEKGCDGVEPDNMDGYTNDTGFNLTPTDQLAYNKFIANESRKLGLSVALKNDVDQIDALEAYFDFSINEQCHEYNECENMQKFIDANKPVFNAEYASKYVNDASQRDALCAESLSLGLSTLVLPLDLDDSYRYSCD